MRNLLYRGPWAAAFTPHNLKRLVVIVGMAYLGGGLLLAWRLVTS